MKFVKNFVISTVAAMSAMCFSPTATATATAPQPIYRMAGGATIGTMYNSFSQACENDIGTYTTVYSKAIFLSSGRYCYNSRTMKVDYVAEYAGKWFKVLSPELIFRNNGPEWVTFGGGQFESVHSSQTVLTFMASVLNSIYVGDTFKIDVSWDASVDGAVKILVINQDGAPSIKRLHFNIAAVDAHNNVVYRNKLKTQYGVNANNHVSFIFENIDLTDAKSVKVDSIVVEYVGGAKRTITKPNVLTPLEFDFVSAGCMFFGISVDECFGINSGD